MEAHFVFLVSHLQNKVYHDVYCLEHYEPLTSEFQLGLGHARFFSCVQSLETHIENTLSHLLRA